MIDFDELSRRFDYHAPDEDRAKRHEALRNNFKAAAVVVTRLTYECREQSLAITALEEAMFWGNAAIAREVG